MTLPSLATIDREIQRRKFAKWLPAARPEFTWNWPHLVYMQTALQAIADDELEHVMFLCPPQHGKTEQNTVSFAAWLLFNDPSRRIAQAAYNQELANKFSRNTRRLAQGWVQFAEDRVAVQEWETKAKGGLRAVGIGAGLTGNPVDIGLIDDPIKDREEADSQLVRNHQWEWYTDVFSTRNPRHKVLTLTPWHEDTLQGRILNSPEAKNWTVIKLPALAEENDPIGREIGDPLCPERKSLEELLMARELNPFSFQAMFQCDPVPREGAQFKVGNLQYADQPPELLRKCRAWDVASSPNGDYTVGTLMGIDSIGRYWILDVQRFRATTDERNARMLEVAMRDGQDCVIRVPEDPGAAGKDAALMYVRLFKGFTVKAARVTGSKETRADPVSSQVNGGNVTLIRGAWNTNFVEELRAFPNGRNDDQVDALSDAFTEIATRPDFFFAIA